MGKLEIATIHGIGAREEQQDSFGRTENSKRWNRWNGQLFVLADGMGGMNGGAEISAMTVVNCLQYFESLDRSRFRTQLLIDILQKTNANVRDYIANVNVSGGTTAILVWQKRNQMIWSSVGDSHLYYYHKGKLTQLNKDHNYASKLEEYVKQGILTREDAEVHPQRKALTSYIGLESLSEISYSEKTIHMRKGDRVLLMSDGVFGTISELEILSFLSMPLQESAIAMEQAILQKKKKNQDNYTAILIERK